MTLVDAVAQIAQNARRIEWDGYEDIPFVNTPVFQDAVGEALAMTASFAVVWWMGSDGIYRFRLYSAPGRYDVASVVGQWGGSGNPRAAEFRSNHLPRAL
jgi:hypothetical protein